MAAFVVQIQLKSLMKLDECCMCVYLSVFYCSLITAVDCDCCVRKLTVCNGAHSLWLCARTRPIWFLCYTQVHIPCRCLAVSMYYRPSTAVNSRQQFLVWFLLVLLSLVSSVLPNVRWFWFMRIVCRKWGLILFFVVNGYEDKVVPEA